MPLAQSLRLDTEAGVGIEHDEVGVTPGRDPPFAGEPREPGGSFGAPASEIAQIPAAVACPGPRGGEPQLERRDAAPCPREIARVEAFELGGRGRMVARHQVERPVGEALPQTLSVAPLTDRRGAFPGRGAVQDLLRGEGQIVRARLGRDWEAGIPGPPEALQRVGRRDMHNVEGAARLATEVEHQLDGLELGGLRA